MYAISDHCIKWSLMVDGNTSKKCDKPSVYKESEYDK